jgi:hypothetical protein
VTDGALHGCRLLGWGKTCSAGAKAEAKKAEAEMARRYREIAVPGPTPRVDPRVRPVWQSLA